MGAKVGSEAAVGVVDAPLSLPFSPLVASVTEPASICCLIVSGIVARLLSPPPNTLSTLVSGMVHRNFLPFFAVITRVRAALPCFSSAVDADAGTVSPVIPTTNLLDRASSARRARKSEVMAEEVEGDEAGMEVGWVSGGEALVLASGECDESESDEAE